MTAPEFQLDRNPFGRLVLTTADGHAHTGVTPVRAFPVGAPKLGLSLISADGHEVLWVPNLDELPEATRQLLEEELATRDFAPQILQLRSVSTYSTPSTWDVKTDRGDTRLVLKGEEDIRRLGGGALLIASGEGVLFRIADMHALDRPSRRLLERFL